MATHAIESQCEEHNTDASHDLPADNVLPDLDVNTDVPTNQNISYINDDPSDDENEEITFQIDETDEVDNRQKKKN